MADPTTVAADWIYAIGVGSNLGDRSRLIAQARGLIEGDHQCRVVGASALIESIPVGGPGGQGAYLNGVWLVASGLGPHQLLHRLQAVETALGRTRGVRNAARTIDLDLLMRSDGLVVASPVLTVPHPRLHLRPFVLGPLAEVAPDWRHPLGATIAVLAQRCRG
ncbi:MAG: 2-amino-4-hydroxy-6-hydroxymethyldihydropteridine diphosphokinase [Planctomycetes bacterium]|nr:2-amino-4-hydroxy-6-hydroxymethyldihydropteridine diphosphokinase [Planctomycetota bacterium]